MRSTSRRELLGAVLGGLAGPANYVIPPTRTVRKRAPSHLVRPSPGPQLFVDDYLILRQQGLRRTTHPPRRMPAPVVGRELGAWQPYMTVIRDEERKVFRMWYNSYARGPDVQEGNYIAYLESGDGVSWYKPRLLLPALGGYGVTVLDDGPGCSDPARRFKLAWWGRKRPDSDDDTGIYVAFSPDGLSWREHPKNPALADYKDYLDPRAPLGAGDIVDAFYNPLTGRYSAFVKSFAVPEDGWLPGPKSGERFRRLVSFTSSVDWVHWETPYRVVVPDQRDEGRLEFYSVGGTVERGGLLVGCPRMLRDDLPADPDGPVEGIGYATLVTSRDGESWERHEDVFFDRNLDPAAFDHAMTWIGCQLLVGDEIYIYYGGYKQGHKVNRYKERQIGLARLRRDGWVSRDASGHEPGWLMTPLLECGGPRLLLVNAEASRGRIRVQARDRWRKVIPGCGFEDCAPLAGDGLAQAVRWRGEETAAALAAGPFHLEFQVAAARLYGFELAGRS